MRTAPLLKDLYDRMEAGETFCYLGGRVSLNVNRSGHDHGNPSTYRIRLDDESGRYVRFVPFDEIEAWYENQ